MSWSKLHERCIDCGRVDRRHKAGGRCVTCHSKFLYRTNPVFAASVKRRAKQWALDHHERLVERVRNYEAARPDKVREWNRAYRLRRARTVKVDVAGVQLEGFVVAYRHEDGEKVADVRMPSGRVITFPRKALYREAAP